MGAPSHGADHLLTQEVPNLDGLAKRNLLRVHQGSLLGLLSGFSIAATGFLEGVL